MRLDEKSKNKKRILLLCPHPVGYVPGQRLKYEQYFQIFEDNGYELTVSPFMSEAFQKIVYKKGKYPQKVLGTLRGYLIRIGDLIRMKKYDIVYVFLWVAPFAPPIFEKLTRKLAKKIIYDIDDLVFLNPPSSSNPFIHYLRSSRNHISLMKSADHVITCTPYLDEFVRKYNSNTTDISSTVDTDKYVPANRYSNDYRITLGWSGSLSTSKYFYLLEGVLKKLKQRYDFSILVMGDRTVNIEGLDIVAIDWEEKTEIENLKRIDIGLYPLPDEQWVYGKSGLKAIQYMALGIPTVATAIGTNFRVIDDTISGYLVKTEEEWIDRLSLLIENPALRRDIGQAARKKVEEYFSIKANASKYLNALKLLFPN
jgi:L-malate glycosyltransferase